MTLAVQYVDEEKVVHKLTRHPFSELLEGKAKGVLLIRHEPYDDPVFGRATWDEASGDWRFTAILPSGRTVTGIVVPEDHALHLSSPKLAESRACIRWVLDNEKSLRQYVADKMYGLMLDWHNDEWGKPLDKDEFCEKIDLTGIHVLEDHRASLLFSDADCFGGHTITFSVGADGRLEEEPYLWG